MNLATRLFLLIALLISLAIGAAVGLTYWLGSQAAARGSEDALKNSQSVQRFFQRRALRELELVSSLMAADRAFVSYVSQALRGGDEGAVDRRSIIDLLDERSAEYGFEFAAVLDPEGRTLAATGDVTAVGEDLSGQAVVARVIESFRDNSGLWVKDDAVLQIAVVPLIRGRTVEGIVVTGNRISPESIAEIARVSNTDLAYITIMDNRPGIASTTLEARPREQLLDYLDARRDLLERVIGEDRSERAVLDLAGQDWEAVLSPLGGESGTQGALVYLVPQERLFAMFRRIATLLLLGGGAALVLALIVSVIAARGFTRPIKSLTRTADDAVKGEYPQRIDSNSKGELGQLERAFNRLVVELREQQAVESYFSALWQQRSVAGYRAKNRGPAEAPSPSAYSVGDVLGERYELTRLVGKGGMGIVFEAHDRELDEVVALKMLKPSMLDNREQIERLKTEIRLARRITHPNVVRTFDFAQINGQAMISMEYMRGITLRQALDQHGRINAYAAMRLARQICSGIAAAHRAGVLHRDIKPGNIIINYSAKVMDFGIANPASKPFARRDDSDTLEGTPEFMSPEQLTGQETDERSDIYSLGIVLMEMFTGQLPHSGQDTMEVAVAQLEKAPQRPATFWPEIPPALEALILRCLEKTPRDRFQTAEELYDELLSLRSRG